MKSVFNLLAVGAALVLSSTPWAQTVDTKENVKDQVLTNMSRLIQQNAFVPGVDFSKWEQFLTEAKPSIEAAKNDEEFSRAVNGALRKFGFSHIVLTTPRDSGMFRTGSTVGIGITTVINSEGALVARTVPGAPAAEAGIEPGDIIIEVDGAKVDGIGRIVGPEGTEVRLKVKKRNGELKEYTLIRRKFSTVRPEEIQWVRPDTARITVSTFGPGYNATNVESLMNEASKAKNLILDLRDNGGGLVPHMRHLLGFFLPARRILGTFVTKDMIEAYREAHGGVDGDIREVSAWSRELEEFRFQQVTPGRSRREPYNGNLVVLINQGSGSGSEIAAAALRDFAGARVIGQRSAGAVLVSVMVPAGHGFMLQYPLSDYVTFKGLRLEGNGVEPDLLSTEPRVRLPGDPDDAIDKAVQEFEKMPKRDII